MQKSQVGIHCRGPPALLSLSRVRDWCTDDVTVFVDPSYDSQNGPPDGSFERPLLTLQAAVALTATSRILTIQLSDAVYTVFPDEPLIIKGNCTIRAPNGPSKVVITCRSALRCAMFQADGTAMRNMAELMNSTYSWWVTLEGLTLDQPGVDTLNAVAPTNEPASLGVTGMLLAGMGRSFVTAYVNVTLRDCEFANQAVGVNALAVTHGVAVLEDVVFRNNTAWGPVMYAGAATAVLSRVFALDNTVGCPLTDGAPFWAGSATVSSC